MPSRMNMSALQSRTGSSGVVVISQKNSKPLRQTRFVEL